MINQTLEAVFNHLLNEVDFSKIPAAHLEMHKWLPAIIQSKEEFKYAAIMLITLVESGIFDHDPYTLVAINGAIYMLVYKYKMASTATDEVSNIIAAMRSSNKF